LAIHFPSPKRRAQILNCGSVGLNIDILAKIGGDEASYFFKVSDILESVQKNFLQFFWGCSGLGRSGSAQGRVRPAILIRRFRHNRRLRETLFLKIIPQVNSVI
jgi:hypothetical protein